MEGFQFTNVPDGVRTAKAGISEGLGGLLQVARTHPAASHHRRHARRCFGKFFKMFSTLAT